MLDIFGFAGAFGVWQWVIILVIALLLFGGGGKIPRLMKDLGKGISSFKKGLKDDKQADEIDEAKAINGNVEDKATDK